MAKKQSIYGRRRATRPSSATLGSALDLSPSKFTTAPADEPPAVTPTSSPLRVLRSPRESRLSPPKRRLATDDAVASGNTVEQSPSSRTRSRVRTDELPVEKVGKINDKPKISPRRYKSRNAVQKKITKLSEQNPTPRTLRRSTRSSASSLSPKKEETPDNPFDELDDTPVTFSKGYIKESLDKVLNKSTKKGKKKIRESMGQKNISHTDKKKSEPKSPKRRKLTPPPPPESLRKSARLSSTAKRTEESPKLNSFFIESQSKPAWSPSMTPTSKPSSPFASKSNSQDDQLANVRISSLTEKLQRITDVQPRSVQASPKKSPRKPVSSGWAFLDDLDDEPAPRPKTTLVKKVTLSPRKEKLPSSHKALIEFFESHHTHQSPPPPEQKEPTPSRESSQTPQPDSTRVSRTRKIYGLQRSYLAEKQQDASSTPSSPSSPSESDNDQESPEHNEHKSITHLRAQGENAQFADEYNFIIEGIETTPSLYSLLELAVKLFDDAFLQYSKNKGVPKLWGMVDHEDDAVVYVLGFIMCKLMDGYGVSDGIHEVCRLLLDAPADVKPRGVSKSTLALFKEFKSKLGQEYTPQFIAVTLMFQNNLALDGELLSGTVAVLDGLNMGVETNVKLYGMMLIMFENYLTSQEFVEQEFEKVYAFMMKNHVGDSRSEVLKLKLMIVLAVKKFPKVYDPTLMLKSLNACLSAETSEVQLLNIGLIISLVEDETCMKKISRPENIKKLHKLYEKATKESMSYYSLLLGTIYAQFPLQIRKQFHRTELDTVILELQRFDKSNKQINLQVQDILEKLTE